MLILEYISTHGTPEWCAARMSARESKGRLLAYEQPCTIMHRRVLALRVARETHSSWLSIPVTLVVLTEHCASDCRHTGPRFNLNFNSVQRALVLEDYAPALRVLEFVSRKKGARRMGEEKKEGKKKK